MTAEPTERSTARGHRLRLLAWICVLILVLGLAAAWVWTPLRETIDIQALASRLTRVRDEPWAPLVLLLGFLVGGLVILPITALIVVAVTVFGPAWGFGYTVIGGTASAMLSFWLGYRLGGRAVRRLAGSRVHRFSEDLGRHGFVAVVLLRIVPLAHFTVVSLWAGASHIRSRDFLAGTVVGMLPGTLAITLLVDRIVAVARRPDPLQFLWLAVLGIAIAAALILPWRWARRNMP